MEKIYYRGRKFVVFDGVYKPAEDSLMIADKIPDCTGMKVLDMGTGCGILAILAALKGGIVTATDINPLSERNLRLNMSINGLKNEIKFIRSNLFDALPRAKYDLIPFNPPYLPCEDKMLESISWCGGKNGRNLIDIFLREVKDFLTLDGYALMVQSSLNSLDRTFELAGREGLTAKVIDMRAFLYEKIYLLKLQIEKR